jgi:DNA-binding MarR family transcriptional regulator
MAIKMQDIQAFRGKLRVLEREIERSVLSQTKCCSVTLAQCHLMMELDGKGETSIKDLSKTLELDKSTLSRTIDAMVNLDYIDRIINPLDRRFMNISLTQKGQEATDSINRMCNQYYLELFHYVPEDKHQELLENIEILVDALLKLRKSVKNPGCCC